MVITVFYDIFQIYLLELSLFIHFFHFYGWACIPKNVEFEFLSCDSISWIFPSKQFYLFSSLYFSFALCLFNLTSIWLWKNIAISKIQSNLHIFSLQFIHIDVEMKFECCGIRYSPKIATINGSFKYFAFLLLLTTHKYAPYPLHRLDKIGKRNEEEKKWNQKLI